MVDYFFIKNTIDNRKERALFLRFLLKRGVLEEFMHFLYLANFNAQDTHRSFVGTGMLPISSSFDYVNNAFPWEFAYKEVYDWSGLNEAWHDYYDIIKRHFKKKL